MREEKIEYIRAKKFPVSVCDVIVLLTAVVLTVVLLFTLRSEKGNNVEIVYQNTRIVLPLSENTEKDVGGHLTVTIRDGYAWVSASDCKNRTCVHTGKISRVGESIVCAQNRVAVTVIGESKLAGSVGR